MNSHKTVLGEHARLDVLLRDLGMVSRWDGALLREKQVRDKIVLDLQFLKVRLLQHFKTEESGSYLEEVRGRKQEAGDALKALQAEHPRFLAELSSIEDTCQEEEDLGVDTYRDVLERLSHMLALLKMHEEKENALIKEVFQS